MNRSIQDASLTKVKALPAQNANNNSDSIDLEVLNGSQLPEGLQVEISIPATPSLANGQTITVTLQSSADDSTFAAIAGLSTLVVTGPASGGGVATTRKVPLPNACLRYLRFNSACSSTAGDNTAVSVTLKLLT